MDTDQIVKQVNWLDEERRKDKTRIGALEEHLADLVEKVDPTARQVKDIQGEITRLSALSNRIDHTDESMLKLRQENKEKSEELEKQQKRRDEDLEKILRADMRSLENALTEMRKEMEQVSDLKRNMASRIEEENRLSRSMDEIRNRMEAYTRGEEEFNRTVLMLDDGRRQDGKRLTDLQGELNATRKRVDDHRGQIELATSTTKRLDSQLREQTAAEIERRETINKFLDNQSLREAERERIWKEWQLRFQAIESQAKDIETTLQTMDTTHRTVKHTQQTVEEMSEKIERRINELTEIQRLEEERFRQEWVTFRADDQKRWTNYTLTMEEQRNETIRQQEKLSERLTNLEDDVQEIQDLIQQMNEHTEKRMQSLLATTHEWVSTFERTIGRPRRG